MPESTLMRMSIECSTLSAMSDRAAKIALTKSAVPILSTVLIDVDAEGVVSMTATDLDKKLVTRGMASDAEIPGAVVVSAAMLARISSSLPQSAVAEIDADDYSMKIFAGRTEVSLRTTLAEEYPEIAIRSKDDISFDIPSKDLSRIIKRSLPFVSRDETRYYISGVYLHADGDHLRCVGTDGHQLCVSSAPLPAGSSEMSGVIIPSDACGHIVKACEKFETVRVSISDSSVSIDTPTAQLSCKVIDGKFPDYTKLIKPLSVFATIPVQEARDAVSRAAMLAEDDCVRLSLDADMLTVSSKSEASGGSSDQIPCAYDADSAERLFTAKILSAALGAITSDDFDIYVEGPWDSPVHIISASDPHDIILMMPRRR